MRSWIEFFQRNKVFHLILMVCYYLLVVLPHEEVGKYIAKVFSKMSRDEYNHIVLICTLIGLLLYLIPLFYNLLKKKPSGKTALFLIINVVLAILCFKMLFVVNVEAIHFVQYGILALLIFPLVESYWKTAFWCLLLGAIDEGWQYFYLAPLRTNYYDFNDVIINAIGAGFGLIFIASYKVPEVSSKSFLKSKETFVGLIMILVTLGLYLTGHLIRKPMSGFWQVVHPQVTYHVIYPIEGILLCVIIIFFYAFLSPAFTDQSKLDLS